MPSKMFAGYEEQLDVSFGYRCNGGIFDCDEDFVRFDCPSEKIKRNSSFSCLSGAALSANATLANTTICNRLIGEGILPGLDSPNSFRSISSSTCLSSLDVLSSSIQNSILASGDSVSSQSDLSEWDLSSLRSMSAPSRTGGFLDASEVQVAGGAAGEDRVQAVCSEQNGWLFCAIYDGFNGRDAADFLAGTLYENVRCYLNQLDVGLENDKNNFNNTHFDGSIQYFLEDNCFDEKKILRSTKGQKESPDSIRSAVLESLRLALAQAENDFLLMVEQEMDDRPDLVSIGSCVMVVLLHGQDLYILNLGDSRAVLAMEESEIYENEVLNAVELTESHTVDNETERLRLLNEHPDDPKTISSGRVKGKLRVTRAFGVGYLKKKDLNDALMGILKVQNLLSPPYISAEPSLNVHRVTRSDHFVIVASDGLFDFFSNEVAVKLVHSYLQEKPSGNPAKFLLEQLVLKAAKNSGMTLEQLMGVPAGSRRKYHDDVTVIVILLGSQQRMSTASTKS
ncbi:putative protein phosphatase 2C 40 [Acorus gramineus]|uniref:protein-serine/threonine phosphatase n=1 Tax=Acorus gramineus TaxID=55184 RepID=A0AAV9BNT3_ACOGR|nr:putative protein phosphatase 2C 40 [Acorus gramineus]